MMLRTYKFRMYPTPTQEVILLEQMEVLKRVHNRLLWVKKNCDSCHAYISKFDMDKLITTWKKIYPEMKKIHSKVLQKVNHNIWGNIRSMEERRNNGHKVGVLRYKSVYSTIPYNQSGFELFEDRNRIEFSKIGEIRTIIHREVEGKIKGIVIKRTRTKKWFALVQSEVESVTLKPTGKKVGIDVNLSDYAVDSDGLALENPKYIDKMLYKLQEQQRKLSKKTKGSKSYSDAKLQLLRLYEQLSDQREDYLNKIVFYYINNYDFIAVEELDVQNMLTSHPKINGKLLNKGFKKTMNRHLLDASFVRFRDKLHLKAESAGREVVEVNPRNTTQRCSNCKKLPTKKKDLSVRKHRCEFCAFSTPRDYNSGHNILQDGLLVSPGWGSPGKPEKDKRLRRVSYTDIVSGKI